LATGGKLAALMQWMRRWGIARVSDEDGDQFGYEVDQPYVVIIRPGIADVLGEAALARIALFTSPGTDSDSADRTAAATEEGGAA
jgi:hypothetical protein